jgi:hypothetical protein
MSFKKETELPLELWKHIKSFFLLKPTCLLCVQRTQSFSPTSSSLSFFKRHNQDNPKSGEYLCKCTTSSTGSLTFSYVCEFHYALNTPMKITLGQKSLFFKVRETYGSNVITMKNLRQRIRKISTNDILRLLCSTKDKKQLADEILRLCDVVVV